MLPKTIIKWCVFPMFLIFIFVWSQVTTVVASDLIEVEVSAVGRSSLAQSPAVLLHSKTEGRVLPIFVGNAEADAIQRYLSGVKTPRPMTHDLIGNLLEVMDGRLERVTVSDFRGSTYFALLQIRVADRVITVDARPSDAIAIALSHNVPIDVARSVMEAHALPYDDAESGQQPDALPQRPKGTDQPSIWI